MFDWNRPTPASSFERAGVHLHDELREAVGVHVADVRRELLVLADLQRIAGEAEDGAHAERPRGEQVGLDGHAVPVAARDLHDRLQPLLEHPARAGQGRQLHRRRLVVGHVRGIHVGRERPGGGANELCIRVNRWAELGGDCEAAGGQHVDEHGAAAYASGRREAPTARGTGPAAAARRPAAGW
jgi:hypothetical protein